MSYCRWSSDNWKCDLYCYEDVNGGWSTHVAGNRIVGEVPPVDMRLLIEGDAENWQIQYRNQHAFLDKCKREPITLPHAGESFNDATLESFRNRVSTLKELGYHVPDFVFDEIDEEIAGQSALEE